MEIKIPKKLISGLLVLVVGIGIVVYFGQSAPTHTGQQAYDSTETVVVTAKGGYFPREVVLPANRNDVVLRMVTKNTYDCSASLLIVKLRIEKFLPPTGSTDILLPAQQPGTEIIAGCAMGMYSFKLKFL
ncbi:cupredoxin domain-containing protein [bacterium]|nr:cupredoxin domain-containing protein [bacterium]